MGLFNKIFGGNDSTAQPSQPSKINLSKEESVHKINLAKEEVHKVCLTKSPLNGLVSRVGLVLDYSGSMSSLYRDGTVQGVIEKILPLAMEFDDNGTMEVWIFESGFHRLPDITLDNFYGYVKNEIIGKYQMGGTNYAPVMQDVFKRYIQEEPAKIPDYIVFITDGDNADHGKTNEIIKKAAEHPIFWQFVGVGNESFNYLKKLDDMKNRYVDNADFFSVSKASAIEYQDLLNEYPGWLADPKVKAMLQ
ncbi:MAG: VWA domain-containing protein [Oscillospiraceae bacterium]|nr:VWA domain-containing protein [Oscillospiraceae bacterium]